MLVSERTGAVCAAIFLCLASGYYIGRWHTIQQYEDESELSDDDEVENAGTAPEECKMVLGVRMDLKMDKGKIAAQCGHATLAAYRLAKRTKPEYVRTWQKLGQTKIAVKIPDEEQLLKLESEAARLGVPARSIQDAGRTQVAPGSRTVIGIGPAPISVIDQLTRQFKLL
ncbi:aminoacyl-tRNA hydrolase [Malassezia cuniculi]|uniref:peptidyl-tRNA hydrolase n=1 Tax=Malassezia cuniculi TaxID=948313 RepID=A0AAF0J7F9_9BASI|nr:aminoacyl-tRNA hydrolase [Malassezia cuniculi]